MNDFIAMEDGRPAWKRPFREAFCLRFDFPPDRYETALFWRSLHRHALLPALLLYRRRPEFFEEDFALVREVASARDNKLFVNELNFFYGRNLRDKNWVRKTFAIRISAKRLLRLKKQLGRDGML